MFRNSDVQFKTTSKKQKAFKYFTNLDNSVEAKEYVRFIKMVLGSILGYFSMKVLVL